MLPGLKSKVVTNQGDVGWVAIAPHFLQSHGAR